MSENPAQKLQREMMKLGLGCTIQIGDDEPVTVTSYCESCGVVSLPQRDDSCPSCGAAYVVRRADEQQTKR